VLVEGAHAGGIRLMECCAPVPGDRIVGVRHAGQGIEVHRIDCTRLADAEGQDWVDLKWHADAGPAVARIRVVVANQPGALAQATAILAQQSANIVNLQLKDRDRAHHSFVMDVEVDDLKHLTNLLSGLKAPRSVVSVERLTG
jgi:GTP diphosphokinase / guanosine-3',5'-bis(diphosphate) 3'-diphosphatase